MFENALIMNNVSYKTKVTYKTLISAGLVGLAVLLPQLVHITVGQSGGITWLPMYMPILIGGCLLGAKWGMAIGMLSPIMSFIITSAMGNPMPIAVRMPFMIAELAVFAIVSGLFTKKISDNGLWAFPAVILSQLTGRTVFLGLVAVFNSIVPFTPAIIWSQIKTGFIGLFAQAIIVPLVIIGLRKVLLREQKND